jgi:hypothetical protein
VKNIATSTGVSVAELNKSMVQERDGRVTKNDILEYVKIE